MIFKTPDRPRGGNDERSRDKLRVRLRSMSDQELLSFSLTAKYMASQQAEFGQFGQSFLIQIEEARAEWKRRMPELP
jgi:hypothetical protein